MLLGATVSDSFHSTSITKYEMQKKFQCPACNKLYSQKRNMQTHFRHNCGKNPRFKCPYCEYLSKHSSNVYSHVRRFHTDQEVALLKLPPSKFY